MSGNRDFKFSTQLDNTTQPLDYISSVKGVWSWSHSHFKFWALDHISGMAEAKVA